MVFLLTMKELYNEYFFIAIWDSLLFLRKVWYTVEKIQVEVPAMIRSLGRLIAAAARAVRE